MEQFFHGPSVAVDEARHARVPRRGRGRGRSGCSRSPPPPCQCGARVHVLPRLPLPEPLSIFPLTVLVQRIALELAEQVESDPDVFGYDVPGRKEVWTALTL